MPTKLLKESLTDIRIDMESDLEVLAVKFNVSQQALSIKIAEFLYSK